MSSFPSPFVGRPREANLNRPTKGGKRNEVERRTEWDLNGLYWEGFFIPSPPSPPAFGALVAPRLEFLFRPQNDENVWEVSQQMPFSLT